jgi:hypothetical protein
MTEMMVVTGLVVHRFTMYLKKGVPSDESSLPVPHNISKT